MKTCFPGRKNRTVAKHRKNVATAEGRELSVLSNGRRGGILSPLRSFANHIPMAFGRDYIVSMLRGVSGSSRQGAVSPERRSCLPRYLRSWRGRGHTTRARDPVLFRNGGRRLLGAPSLREQALPSFW